MSLQYVENCIRQALEQSKGNATKARQIIMRRCEDDPKLLFGLTKAHLTGIVAYNIERVASGRSAKPKLSPPMPPPKGRDKFGIEVLKAVVNSGQLFGFDAESAPRRKPEVSQRHIDAIKKMASKSKPKK